MNLIPSASGWLCFGKTQSNRNIRKRIEDCKSFASSGFARALLLTIIISPVAAQSQQTPPVTISQAVREAVEKNLSLLAERYNLSVADARIISARLRPNPVLSLYGDLLDLAGTGFNEQNMAGPPEYGIRTDFIWERGQKRRYRIEVAEHEKAVARWLLLNATRSLALDVQNAFVEVLLTKETLALAEQNLESFHKIVEVSKERVRVGDLAQVELVRTQLAELQFNNAVIQAQSRLRIAKQRLQLLMGRATPSELFDVAGDMRREPLPFTFDELWRQALARRPDYQAMLRDQARSVAELRSQIAQGKVDYTIGTEFRRQQGIAGTGNSLGFFFSAPLPLFNRNQGEISRAREERGQVEARTRALEAGIRNELDAAWRQYETARSLLTRIEGAMLDKARGVLASMEYSYRAGEASLVEFLDAQRAFNETMQGYNEARAEYARGLYLIDSVTGKEAW
ncbi:MAG TPA: TolC family protein [Blastocatellia bacterium]|jgi:cobalt-zinc-cadmium efflux system outer membrane protein|nr:TolC family protein [Blastocatellia bacterium]